MIDSRLLRALDLFRVRLGARRLRMELAAGDGSWVTTEVRLALEDGWCLVAEFEQPVDDPDGVEERMRVLLEAFGSIRDPHEGAARIAERLEMPGRRVLEETLAYLVDSAAADLAVLIDSSSPEIWAGFGFPRDGVDTADLLHTADLADRLGLESPSAGLLLSGQLTADDGVAHLAAELQNRLGERTPEEWDRWVLASRWASLTRRHSHERRIFRELEPSGIARRFCGGYWIALGYRHSVSELQADGHLIRVMPRLEYLVQHLPPVDPDRSRGTVIHLQSRRP